MTNSIIVTTIQHFIENKLCKNNGAAQLLEKVGETLSRQQREAALLLLVGGQHRLKWDMDHWVTDPVQMFNDHIRRLGRLRDLIQTKLSTYIARMFGLENLLNALISTKGMTDDSELEISKESVTYWKDKFESRVAMLDKEVNHL